VSVGVRRQAIQSSGDGPLGAAPEVAGELGVGYESPRLWPKRNQLDRGERDDGMTREERDELGKLRPQPAFEAHAAQATSQPAAETNAPTIIP
jgi:hypothetical protein